MIWAVANFFFCCKSVANFFFDDVDFYFSLIIGAPGLLAISVVKLFLRVLFWDFPPWLKKNQRSLLYSKSAADWIVSIDRMNEEWAGRKATLVYRLFLTMTTAKPYYTSR